MCRNGVITQPIMFAGGMYEKSASDLTMDLHFISAGSIEQVNIVAYIVLTAKTN
jgi:hypothetical protein